MSCASIGRLPKNGVSSLFGHGLEGMTLIDDAVYVRVDGTLHSG